MKPILTVQKFMTFMPRTIGFDQSLASAQEVMNKLHVRHLPVIKGGQLVGIISDRDIDFILRFRDVDPESITVEDAYTAEPYFTDPDAPLKDVVTKMAEHKYGSALVVENGKVVGIFTASDAYRALAALLD